MNKRQPNPRLAKIHRSYTVEEVARLFNTHKNTVRQWIKSGLPTCDTKRPYLILGRELRAFLQSRRAGKKRPCGPGELYCVRCRAPRPPAEGMVDYQATSGTLGNLTAICPECDTLMNRRTSLARLKQFEDVFNVTFPLALRRLNESSQPSVNSDFG
jgi:excisionase family DNA binding protein